MTPQRYLSTPSEIRAWRREKAVADWTVGETASTMEFRDLIYSTNSGFY